MAKMFIPKKLKIGFQTRKDTFTEKLAYVIYYDEKGALRKEASWTSWCDSKIPSMEIDNVPTIGYVFNKGIKRDGYWGNGRSVIRVHDPRGFEFEISVNNMIGLLMHSDVAKREIQQECVFAWQGTELCLLPTNSVEYQESVEFTERQDKKISAKALIKGATYKAKKNETTYVYLGYFPWYDWEYSRHDSDKVQKLKGKRHVFAVGYCGNCKFETPSISTLAEVVDETVCENYPQLVDDFHRTFHSSKIVGFQIDFTPRSDVYFERLSYAYEHGWVESQVTHSSRPRQRDYDNKSFELENYKYGQIPLSHSYYLGEGEGFTKLCLSRRKVEYKYGGWYSNQNHQKCEVSDKFKRLCADYRQNNPEYSSYAVALPEEVLYNFYKQLGLGTVAFKLENGNITKRN